MRSVRRVILAAMSLGAAMLLTGWVFAGQQAPPPQPGGPGGGRPRGQRIEERLERLSKALNLTEDQKEKLKPILQDQAQQMRALREDSSLTPEQRREKARELFKAHREEIAKILTPEQREKWKEMRERREERREHKGGPPPEKQ